MKREKKYVILDSNEQRPETIQSINELVTALSEGERSDFNNIIRSIDISTSAFENCCSWSTDCYTRNCVYENEQFELILLCWEKGQVTPIHDHGGEECWVKIVKGEFKETIYKVCDEGNLQTIKSTVAKTGDVTYMIDFMGCHRLENLSNKRSMSLHIYAKPIRNCNAFDESLGEFVRKDLVYNTVFELEETIK